MVEQAAEVRVGPSLPDLIPALLSVPQIWGLQELSRGLNTRPDAHPMHTLFLNPCPMALSGRVKMPRMSSSLVGRPDGQTA